MPNKFYRINQDELKARPKCECRLKQVLSMSPHLCPIIDRCNFDGQQLSTFYRLAEEAAGQGSLPTTAPPPSTSPITPPTIKCSNEISEPESVVTTPSQPTMAPTGIPVDVVVLDLPYEECLRRCEKRHGHETIKSSQQAVGVLRQQKRQWSPPYHSKNANEKSRY